MREVSRRQRSQLYDISEKKTLETVKLSTIGAKKITQWVDALAAEPGDMGSIPRTHVKVKGENQLHSCPLSPHVPWNMHAKMYTYRTHSNKQILLKVNNCQGKGQVDRWCTENF